ncbi:MAG TPA: four helix bundle protein [Phycisphaerales bacterium]|nr:four helix bundle protein [Phycisphaerales bacterium]
MGRLRTPLLDRVEAFADRGLAFARKMEDEGVWNRVIDQTVGCFTSVGANVFEADEAMSRKDFCKALAISVKELNESRFWIRRAAKNAWVSAKRLAPLEAEAVELKRILGAMVLRTAQSTGRDGQRKKPS